MNRVRSHCRRKAAVSPAIRRLLIAALAFVASACGPMGASPIPQPPTGDIAVDKLRFVPPDPASNGPLFLQALPGSVPAGVEVHATVLDSIEPPEATIAAADGSFAFGLRIDPGVEVRLEWLGSSARSRPTDVVLSSDEKWLTAPRFDCVALDPGFTLDLSAPASTTLTLRSTCAEVVQISDPRLRLATPDFSLLTALPSELPAGESLALDVQFQRMTPGAHEDVLFLNLTRGTETIRYPVTLLAAP